MFQCHPIRGWKNLTVTVLYLSKALFWSSSGERVDSCGTIVAVAGLKAPVFIT